jgi:hypothetical protein
MRGRRVPREHQAMAKMQFRAAPVTPAKPPRKRRIGSLKAEASSTLSGALPFDESSWNLREGLDLREGDADDFSTSPGKLWNLPKPAPKP